MFFDNLGFPLILDNASDGTILPLGLGVGVCLAALLLLRGSRRRRQARQREKEQQRQAQRAKIRHQSRSFPDHRGEGAFPDLLEDTELPRRRPVSIPHLRFQFFLILGMIVALFVVGYVQKLGG